MEKDWKYLVKKLIENKYDYISVVDIVEVNSDSSNPHKKPYYLVKMDVRDPDSLDLMVYQELEEYVFKLGKFMGNKKLIPDHI